MNKLSFSGHDTFYCRHFWLKKGYDYFKAGKSFTSKTAVIDLGVGKNMVSSIRFWLRAFGLIKYNKKTQNEVLSQFAQLIFDNEIAYDPYLEDTNTLWLLHYFLVTTQRASIYSLVFNQFRKERIEFTKAHLNNFLHRVYYEQYNTEANAGTIKRDVGVFVRNYLRPNIKSEDKPNIEEAFSALLIELNLLKEIERIGDKSKWYKIESAERGNLSVDILLFSILNNPKYENTVSISFSSLLNDTNSIGLVYVLTPDGLINKIEEMTKKFPFLVYSDDAGIRELQFKSKPNKWDILNEYYKNNML